MKRVKKFLKMSKLSEKYTENLFNSFDKVFIVFLLVISVILTLLRFSGSDGDLKYVIRSKQPEFKKILFKPSKNPLLVKGKLGTTVVEWDLKGRVRIKSSPCPFKTCVSMGWVHGNSSIVCVPNGVIVETQHSTEEIDGVAR